MKNLIVLALTVVSVTSFADTVRIKCIPAHIGGGSAEGSVNTTPNTFTGGIQLTTQADEVVFADSSLSILTNDVDSKPALLNLEEMYGTQRTIPAGQLMKDAVKSVELSSSEDSNVSARLVMNLGMKGTNSLLTVDSKISYSSSCAVESESAE